MTVATTVALASLAVAVAGLIAAGLALVRIRHTSRRHDDIVDAVDALDQRVMALTRVLEPTGPRHLESGVVLRLPTQSAASADGRVRPPLSPPSPPLVPEE